MAILVNSCLIFMWLVIPVLAQATARPLVDFDFDGFIQGRFTTLTNQHEHAKGPLNTSMDFAEGDMDTQAKIEQLNFSISSPIFNDNWMIKISATTNATKVLFKSGYLQWIPHPLLQCRVGLIDVPFGLENSVNEDLLDTINYSLIYGFGNFGWVAPLGLAVIERYAYGINMSVSPPHNETSFVQPFLHTALVAATGQQLSSDLASQLIFRTGLDLNNHRRSSHDRSTLMWALSAAYSWSQFDQQHHDYIPIGINGDLNSHPDHAISTQDLGEEGRTLLLGTDLSFKYADFRISGEWITRSIGHELIHGYYLQSNYNLPLGPQPRLALLIKWEEIQSMLADGAHQPGTRYQALTFGFNWIIIKNWKAQLNYITLYENGHAHSFNGSDLLITQLQWQF